jgi:hypothetical protein
VPSLAFQVCDSAAADLNDDGKPELLAADHLKPAFGYFVNASSDADGVAFGSGVRVPFDQGDNSAGIVTADFNGDGRLDVANSNHPGTLTVRINGTARGASELSFPVLGETNIPLDVQYGPSFGIAGREGGLVTADFNADGRPDLATADLGQTAEPRSGRSKSCPGGDPTASRQMAAVLLNTTEVGASKATYAPTTYFPIAGPAISIASADFDGDGRPDLLTANTGDGSLSVLKNLTEPEAGVPCFGPGLRLKIPDGGLSHGAGPTNAIAIDVNGDGRPDIATANWNVRTVTVRINTTPSEPSGGVPTFSDPFIFSTGDLPPLVLRSGDLDQDGLDDLVVIPLSTHSNAAFMVLRNETVRGSSEAAFEVDAIYSIPRVLEHPWLHEYFSSAGLVHDFDADGRLEIAVLIARGSLLLKLMSPGNDVLAFVDPGVPLWVVHPVLPDHTMVVVYDPDPAADERARARATPASIEPEEQTPFCALARATLDDLSSQVVVVGRLHRQQGRSDVEVRSKQAEYSAARLQELVADAPRSIRKQVQMLVDFVQQASLRVRKEASWHVEHDVEDAVRDITAYLRKSCPS